MKTQFDVVDRVYLRLTLRPLFKHNYPDDYNEDKFAVINCLEVPTDSIQTVEVNVNCYARDIQKGIPDHTELVTMFNYVIGRLNHFNDDVVDIEYTGGQIFREESRLWHYYNMRFKLIFISN
jgi:hypothetical protein